MRVLVLGASGFIGSHVAARLAADGWSVRAGARRIQDARRRAPFLEWVRADFALLSRPDAWAPLLEDVDAVVNCVGVLQDGARESAWIAHEAGPLALFQACRERGLDRIVHLSAVGADAATTYGRTKLAAEDALFKGGSGIVVRPSLVVARGVFGGTALIRGLAGFPCVIPVVGGDQIFRPIAMSDLSALIADLLGRPYACIGMVEALGPESIALTQLLKAYRAWLGFSPASVVRAPRWLTWPALKVGDALGWLGWPSAMRSTSLQQMDHDVAGRGAASVPLAKAFSQFLAEEPASVQDRWHARLYFVRPFALVALAMFWVASGLIALGPASAPAAAVLAEGGFGPSSALLNATAALVDIGIGAGLLVRAWTRRSALASVAVCVGYLVVGTVALPALWLDPLGPWLKIVPALIAALFIAATDDR